MTRPKSTPAEQQKASKLRRKIREGERISPSLHSWLKAYERRMNYTRGGADAPAPAVEKRAPAIEPGPSASLAELAKEQADISPSSGGACPSCKAPTSDGQKHCGKCGQVVNLALCPKCEHPIEKDAAFCGTCGTARAAAAPPAPSLAALSQEPATGLKSSSAEPRADVIPIRGDAPRLTWSPEKIAWVAGPINLVLERSGYDPLDAKEVDELCEAAAPVLNKWAQPSGEWAEEIRLAVVFFTLGFSRWYVKHVVLADRERAAATGVRQAA